MWGTKDKDVKYQSLCPWGASILVGKWMIINKQIHLYQMVLSAVEGSKAR